MTDKQIIFKCDVDCIRKNTEECFELDCIKGQESILKQLQTKEQECEELKENLPNAITRLMGELDQLKAENEVLEKVNKVNQEKIKKLNEQLEEEFITQQYADMALFWKVEDYKQALTEIKEIITKSCIDIDDNDYIHLSHIKQILQKCEVLDE